MYTPLDLPPMPTGKPMLPEARMFMMATIRSRQNAEADFMDSIGMKYDWDGELRDRWMPGNGAYYPEYHYKKEDHG